MDNPAVVSKFWKRHGWPWLVVIVPLLVLFPLCGYDFITFDDPVNVSGNIFLSHFSWANLLYFWQGTYEFLYIPLTYTIWGMVAIISQLVHGDGSSLDPHLFHGLNLLIHGLSTGVLYRILRQLLADKWGAAAGAVFFAVHPVQVEAVAWVTGFKDVLSGFWCLLSLWFYLLASRAEYAGRQHWWYGAATLAYLLAMLSKPTAVVLPVLVGIVGRLLLRKPWRQLARELLPWLVLALPLVWVTAATQSGRVLDFVPTPWQRLLVAGDAVCFYLYKLFLPLTLGFDYGRMPQYVLGQGWIYLTGILPYCAALYLVIQGRRPQLLAGAGLFLLPLLPVLGFLPFNFQNMSTVADRYLYLALLGPAFLLGWLLTIYRNRVVAGITLAVLLLLMLRTSLLLPHWENSQAFYRQALAVNPRSWTSLLNLGLEKVEQGEAVAALADFQQALALKADLPRAHFGMGTAYEKLGDKPAAIAAYQQALMLEPQYDEAYERLGLIAYELGKKEEAIEYFKKAVAVDPGSLRAARFYADLGKAFAATGNSEWAIFAYRKALALNPYLPEGETALKELEAAARR
ncbi:MAG: tetratricopeptide repeat protein [Desulfobulbaceae bacterium]|nr:tetratricopeptide repeat protein [Desulfobulbaceae bacterium]